MNETIQTQSGASAESNIDIGTNVFFDIKGRKYITRGRPYTKQYRQRGIVESVIGQNVIIDDRRGGKHNRNILKVKRV